MRLLRENVNYFSYTKIIDYNQINFGKTFFDQKFCDKIAVVDENCRLLFLIFL